jgi:hypothetical protein
LGGAIFIQNNDKGKAIVDEWMRLTLIDNCRFLVPSSFVFPNPSEFVHHAHDQAILSCLIKTRATKSVTFFEGFVPQSSASSHREVATTAPFIPARHRYAFPIHSKSILRRFFWKTIAIISKARLAICRRVFKKSVDSFLDR